VSARRIARGGTLTGLSSQHRSAVAGFETAELGSSVNAITGQDWQYHWHAGAGPTMELGKVQDLQARTVRHYRTGETRRAGSGNAERALLNRLSTGDHQWPACRSWFLGLNNSGTLMRGLFLRKSRRLRRLRPRPIRQQATCQALGACWNSTFTSAAAAIGGGIFCSLAAI